MHGEAWMMGNNNIFYEDEEGAKKSTRVMSSVLKLLRPHEVHIYLEYHSVCPPRPNWDPHLLSRKRVCPPGTKGGGTHSLGAGSSQFGRLEKKPSTLSTLCPASTAPSVRGRIRTALS
jgi:hypothetical protein